MVSWVLTLIVVALIVLTLWFFAEWTISVLQLSRADSDSSAEALSSAKGKVT